MSSFGVIGASSMLGKELIRQLIARGDSVVKIGRDIDNDIIFDLTSDFKSLKGKIPKVDAIFHCASSFEGDESDGIKINFKTNTLGCLNVLLLMNALDCRHICFAGTLFSYDTFDSRGMNSYALSKAQGEKILEWGLSNLGGFFCSLRFTQLYDSEGLCCTHQPWFGRIIAYASKGKNINLPTSKGVRNYMHVYDAALFMIQSVEKKLVGYFPACHNEYFSHTEIVLMAFREFNLGGQVFIDEKKEPFRFLNYPDKQILYKQLNREPSICMKKGLQMIASSSNLAKYGSMDIQ